LWFNRYGFPAHLEPWTQIGAAGGNDFEVNFMRDYKNLHDAGYNVLTYDMRNFGHSGAANGGVGTNGIFESRDVVGSLQYVKRREDTRNMSVGLFSRCCGGNATYMAMTKYPEHFREVRCLVNPQPVSLRPFYERITEILGIEDQFDNIDREIQLITSFKIDQMSPIPWAKNCHVPTFITQVRNDALTKESDVQAIFDNIPAEDKKLFWIENSTRRWDGYNYFPEHPEQMLEWFDKHMT
jgi:alpha/beta superfamily hydrolase